MSRPLGVAVVGLGIGEQHARAFAAQRGCQVRWLCDLDRARAEKLVGAFPGAAVAGSFEELLGRPEVDVVSIASFDDAHAAQVSAALAAGKHVFVEKPLCRTPEELRRIKEGWLASGGRMLGCNLVLRTAPLYLWLRDAMARGELGEIFSFDGDYLYGRLHKITEGWRSTVEDYSVMLGGGIHLIDLLLWLTGRRPVAVSASGSRIGSVGTAFRYNDFCAATLRFEGGLVARITANFGCVHRHQHALRVFGTSGTFLYDDSGARLHRSRDPGDEPQRLEHSPLPRTKGDLVPGFVEAIESGRDLRADVQQVCDGVSVAMACDRAMASGNWETVDYV
jgi:predicted dehydrogenase